MYTKAIEIRQEKKQDYSETEYMTLKSFWNRHAPGCNEHLLVRKLRESDITGRQLSYKDSKLVF